MDKIDEKKYTLERLGFGAKLYSFMIDRSRLSWLRIEAKERRISVSQLIRDAIELYIKVNA